MVGSYVFGCKTCAVCRQKLVAGSLRHSCKPCAYHLCASCYASVLEAFKHEEIVVTIYCAGKPASFVAPGVQEDAWQVRIERGVDVSELRRQIQALYGVPRALQTLRRDIDSAPLADAELLALDDGDVVHLCVAGPADFFGALGADGLQPISGANILAPLAGLAQRMAAEVAEMGRAAQEAFDHTTYTVNFVLPAAAPKEADRRCRVEISASARVVEVLEMVKLELDAEGEALQLEFAGQVLHPDTSLHVVGVRDGDTVLIGPVAGA